MSTTRTRHPLPSPRFRQPAGARPAPLLPLLGFVLGEAVAVVILLWAGVTLVRLEGNDLKALVPVWLWILPALGVFGGAGWLIGSALAAAGLARGRRS